LLSSVLYDDRLPWRSPKRLHYIDPGAYAGIGSHPELTMLARSDSYHEALWLLYEQFHIVVPYLPCGLVLASNTLLLAQLGAV
jgi:hypothetical protein